MIHENIELTGSLNVTGSIIVPIGGNSDRVNITGSLFFNTASNELEVYSGEGDSGWEDVFTASSGGGEGGGGGGGGVGTFTASPLNYLVVAGGGGGGSRYYGGGGGGGGFLSSSIASTNSSIASGSIFTMTVGAGGAASPSSGDGGNGGNSSIAATGLTTITSTGGGGGGGSTTGGANQADGNDGGSGGGPRSWSGAQLHGQGTTGQGHRSGVQDSTHADYIPAFVEAQYSPANNWGGGGGGAGEPGSHTHYQSTNNITPGAGGDGSGSMITGTSVTYAGGGGGGFNANNPSYTPHPNGVAPGGSGGGGNGGKGWTTPYSPATAGSTNLGGGGGAGSHSGATNGAAGGSGIVIVSYDSGSMGGAGGIKGDAGNGNRYHVFNSSDTFKLGNNDDFDVVTSSLVAHYDAGDFSSRGTSTFTDLAGSTNGTVSGATLGANWYYDFDGSNDNITFGDVTWFDSGDFTFEIWVRVNTSEDGNFGVIASKRNNGDYISPFQVWFDDRTSKGRNNTFTFAMGEGGSNTMLARNDSGEYTLGDWAHLVCTISGTSCVLYLDGSSYATDTFSGTRQTNNTTFRLNGPYTAGSSTDFLDCDIAQVRVYDDALSAAEVLQNYNATKQNFI